MNTSKRLTLATLAGGVAAAATFNAFAQRRGGGMHGPMDLDRMLNHLYVEINATEEQKQRLDPLVRQTVKELSPLRESLRNGRQEAFGLLAQDRVDPAALEALRTRQIELADQASRTVTKAFVEAAEVLNPAQRKQLAAHFARQRGRRHFPFT